MATLKNSVIARRVVKSLAIASLVAVGSLLNPRLPSDLLKELARRSKLSQPKTRSGLAYAKRQGWIELRERGARIELLLSTKGETYWQKLQINRPLKQRRWDGQWRMVIFDIPTRYRTGRDALRLNLKRLGFTQLQKSIWITPYECKPEVQALRVMYGLSPFVKLLTVKDFEGANDYIKKYNLRV